MILDFLLGVFSFLMWWVFLPIIVLTAIGGVQRKLNRGKTANQQGSMTRYKLTRRDSLDSDSDIEDDTENEYSGYSSSAKVDRDISRFSSDHDDSLLKKPVEKRRQSRLPKWKRTNGRWVLRGKDKNVKNEGRGKTRSGRDGPKDSKKSRHDARMMAEGSESESGVGRSRRLGVEFDQDEITQSDSENSKHVNSSDEDGRSLKKRESSKVPDAKSVSPDPTHPPRAAKSFVQEAVAFHEPLSKHPRPASEAPSRDDILAEIRAKGKMGSEVGSNASKMGLLKGKNKNKLLGTFRSIKLFAQEQKRKTKEARSNDRQQKTKDEKKRSSLRRKEGKDGFLPEQEASQDGQDNPLQPRIFVTPPTLPTPPMPPPTPHGETAGVRPLTPPPPSQVFQEAGSELSPIRPTAMSMSVTPDGYKRVQSQSSGGGAAAKGKIGVGGELVPASKQNVCLFSIIAGLRLDGVDAARFGEQGQGGDSWTLYYTFSELLVFPYLEGTLRKCISEAANQQKLLREHEASLLHMIKPNTTSHVCASDKKSHDQPPEHSTAAASWEATWKILCNNSSGGSDKVAKAADAVLMAFLRSGEELRQQYLALESQEGTSRRVDLGVSPPQSENMADVLLGAALSLAGDELLL